MKKFKNLNIISRIIIMVCVIAMMAIALLANIGCTQSAVVAYNISKEADAFNVQRKITVINARTDTIMLEMVGTFSLQNNGSNELEVICEVAPDTYQKHFIYLNEYTLYVVEDVSNTNVDKYHYELNILPLLNTPQVVIDVTD